MDECQENGYSLCGERAECYNIPGSYECRCPPGYEGEPYGGRCEVIQTPGCQSDRDCQYDEACDTFSGVCYGKQDFLKVTYVFIEVLLSCRALNI